MMQIQWHLCDLEGVEKVHDPVEQPVKMRYYSTSFQEILVLHYSVIHRTHIQQHGVGSYEYVHLI